MLFACLKENYQTGENEMVARKAILATLVFAIFGSCLLCGCSSNNRKSRLIANLDAGETQTVVTYGTSLTAGAPWVAQLKDALDQQYPGKVQLINSAKGGMWSKWGVDNFEQRVIEKKPDTVLIEFAINDAYLPYKTPIEEARANIEYMIDHLLEYNSECEIILMVMNPPVGVHLERRPRVEEYYQIYRDVAEERGLQLIDHYPRWQDILNTDKSLFDRYVPDGIHPGQEGCSEVITPTVLQALGIVTEE